MLHVFESGKIYSGTNGVMTNWAAQVQLSVQPYHLFSAKIMSSSTSQENKLIRIAFKGNRAQLCLCCRTVLTNATAVVACEEPLCYWSVNYSQLTRLTFHHMVDFRSGVMRLLNWVVSLVLKYSTSQRFGHNISFSFLLICRLTMKELLCEIQRRRADGFYVWFPTIKCRGGGALQVIYSIFKEHLTNNTSTEFYSGTSSHLVWT